MFCHLDKRRCTCKQISRLGQDGSESCAFISYLRSKYVSQVRRSQGFARFRWTSRLSLTLELDLGRMGFPEPFHERSYLGPASIYVLKLASAHRYPQNSPHPPIIILPDFHMFALMCSLHQQFHLCSPLEHTSLLQTPILALSKQGLSVDFG